MGVEARTEYFISLFANKISVGQIKIPSSDQIKIKIKIKLRYMFQPF